jgi:uncharacterized protein YjdB
LAQKGPLIAGSTVIVQELTSALGPTGRQYTFQISSDMGSFASTASYSAPYLSATATGYYFDEVANGLSAGTVTLNAYADLTTDSTLNINLLTTLAYSRIQRLVSGGQALAAARSQAEREVLAAFNIPATDYASFGGLDVAGNRNADHILTAISTLLVYGNSSGALSQLIANIQNDIAANGRITNAATLSALQNAAGKVDPVAVASNLTGRYAAQGIAFASASISDWIDRDADGVIAKYDYSVPGATPGATFSIPSALVSLYAGTMWSVSAGKLIVNGSLMPGATLVQAGDSVAVTPAGGTFPNGLLPVYVQSGSSKVAKVSFISGLLSIALSPANGSVPKGATQAMTATGTFSDNSISDVTARVTWSSSTPATATIAGTTGVVTARTVGTSTITAVSGAVSASTTFNVSAAVVTSIVVGPDSAYTGVSLPKAMSATATYSDGTTGDVTATAKWSSAAPAIASVSSVGVVTGVSAGIASVAATIGQVTANTSITVIASNGWLLTGAMTFARGGYAVTRLADGKVLASGGASNSALGSLFYFQGYAEIYDPALRIWLSLGSVGARANHTSILLNSGKVLVAGGLSGTLFTQVTTDSAELFDRSTGRSTSTGSMVSSSRSAFTMTLLHDGRVLAVGGIRQTTVPYNQYVTVTLDSAEIYSPATGSWTPAASMSQPRAGHSAFLLPDGRVIVVGGNAGDFLATPEIYDPTTGSWTMAAAPPIAQSGATTALLSNNKLIVAGGSAAGAIASTVQTYDVATNTWAPAASLPVAQAGMQSVLLQNGKWLIAGGVTFSEPLRTAYVYDPAANQWTAAQNLLQPVGTLTTLTPLSDGTVLATGVDGSSEVFFPGP